MFDYLEFGDGLDETSSFIGKYCTDFIPQVQTYIQKYFGSLAHHS